MMVNTVIEKDTFGFIVYPVIATNVLLSVIYQLYKE